jgi:hypothetical protein
MLISSDKPVNITLYNNTHLIIPRRRILRTSGFSNVENIRTREQLRTALKE